MSFFKYIFSSKRFQCFPAEVWGGTFLQKSYLKHEYWRQKATNLAFELSYLQGQKELLKMSFCLHNVWAEQPTNLDLKSFAPLPNREMVFPSAMVMNVHMYF